MSKRRARYSAEFKQDAVSRMGQRGKTVTALTEELGVGRKFLYLWRERLGAGWRQARRWSEAGGGRQGANRKSVPAVSRRCSLSCGSQNWSGCQAASKWNWIFFKRTFEHMSGEQPRIVPAMAAVGSMAVHRSHALIRRE